MKIIRDSNGNVSQFALIIVLVAVIISSAMFILLKSLHKVTGREQIRIELLKEFDEANKEIINELIDDKTPESDSMFDLYDKGYQYYIDRDEFEKTFNDFTVIIREHSGKLNINTFHTNLVTNTELQNAFNSNEYTIKDFRTEIGFTLKLNDYEELFSNESDMKHFTVYGYANINIAYDDSLRLAGIYRSGNEAIGENIMNIAQTYRGNLKLINDEEFKLKVLAPYPEVFPLINTQPVLNVNFATERIIKIICSYPYGLKVIKNAESISQTIISIRNQKEILPDELITLIPLQTDMQKRIFQYFGTQSWFWEIEIIKGNNKSKTILSRIPPKEEDGKTSFRILEYWIE